MWSLVFKYALLFYNFYNFSTSVQNQLSFLKKKKKAIKIYKSAKWTNSGTEKE